MPRSITLSSPAKINLYLKVKRKRPDGYHDIVTLFERVDLCDTLTFTLNFLGKIRISCDSSQVPTGPKNLVHKVARSLREKYGIKQGVDIHIRKIIPVAAGLAGGSSNAATALLALNRLWNLNLAQDKLIALGRKIGSDVAFFLHDRSYAVGTQKGDVIRGVRCATKLTHLVVVPCIKLYASKVYGVLKIKLTHRSDDANILIRRLRQNDINGASSLMVNDLESAVFRLQPNLLRLKKRLNSLEAQGVMVSGSGPAVFALMENESQAQRLKKLLSKTYSRVFVVRTR